VWNVPSAERKDGFSSFDRLKFGTFGMCGSVLLRYRKAAEIHGSFNTKKDEKAWSARSDLEDFFVSFRIFREIRVRGHSHPFLFTSVIFRCFGIFRGEDHDTDRYADAEST